ncbi:hypothetical protein L218DRAFT_949719 [Marasmius fiardii PR-910]|nr:hypothetical protein L218DRAFT_949719 [Marasmius fiardii PR-910]
MIITIFQPLVQITRLSSKCKLPREPKTVYILQWATGRRWRQFLIIDRSVVRVKSKFDWRRAYLSILTVNGKGSRWRGREMMPTGDVEAQNGCQDWEDTSKGEKDVTLAPAWTVILTVYTTRTIRPFPIHSSPIRSPEDAIGEIVKENYLKAIPIAGVEAFLSPIAFLDFCNGDTQKSIATQTSQTTLGPSRLQGQALKFMGYLIALPICMRHPHPERNTLGPRRPSVTAVNTRNGPGLWVALDHSYLLEHYKNECTVHTMPTISEKGYQSRLDNKNEDLPNDYAHIRMTAVKALATLSKRYSLITAEEKFSGSLGIDAACRLQEQLDGG